MKVLLIAGDKKLANTLDRKLEEAQYGVSYAPDGEVGLKKALEDQFDLIVLDWILPKKNGLDVLKKLRERQSFSQVLMMTAEDSAGEAVLSLGFGADACVAKSFGVRVLLARVNALIRRNKWDRGAEIGSGRIRLDPVKHKVWRDGREIKLTALEYSLLAYFMRNPGHVLTRNMIAENVWGRTLSSFQNNVNVYIKSLRDKIDNGADKKLIHTVKGVGYTFTLVH
jgi:DNA-binding response OmpR family regulator